MLRGKAIHSTVRRRGVAAVTSGPGRVPHLGAWPTGSRPGCFSRWQLPSCFWSASSRSPTSAPGASSRWVTRPWPRARCWSSCRRPSPRSGAPRAPSGALSSPGRCPTARPMMPPSGRSSATGSASGPLQTDRQPSPGSTAWSSARWPSWTRCWRPTPCRGGMRRWRWSPPGRGGC